MLVACVVVVLRTAQAVAVSKSSRRARVASLRRLEVVWSWVCSSVCSARFSARACGAVAVLAAVRQNQPAGGTSRQAAMKMKRGASFEWLRAARMKHRAGIMLRCSERAFRMTRIDIC